MKVALITGASKGIGSAIAVEMAEQGYYSIATYHRDKEGGSETARKINAVKGGKGSKVFLDVRSEESVERVFNQIRERFGHLDVLINNAGIERPSPVETCSMKDWRDVVATKWDGTFLCTRYGIPLLKKAAKAHGKSHIFNIVSGLGEVPDARYPAYCVSTAGVIIFTKLMAAQLGKNGIRVNGIAPAPTPTEMWKHINPAKQKDPNFFLKQNVLKQASTPETVARIIRAYVSEGCRDLTGNIIHIGGKDHLA